MRHFLAFLVVLVAALAAFLPRDAHGPDAPRGEPLHRATAVTNAVASEAPLEGVGSQLVRRPVERELASGAALLATEAAAKLVVEVVDTEGDGVSEASVVLVQPVDEGTTRFEPATTDRDGFAELVVPSGRSLKVRAGHRGETTETEVEVAPLTVGEVRPLVIEVTHRRSTAAEVLVRVLTNEKAPIVGAALHVARHAHSTTGGPAQLLAQDASADTVTDVLGEARIRTEALGITSAMVRAQGFAPRLVQLRGPKTAERPKSVVEVTLTGAARAEGRVEGAPAGALARATVPAYGLRSSAEPLEMWMFSDFRIEAEVLPDGTFTLEDLPTGAPLQFELAHDRRTLVSEPDVVTLGAGDVQRIEWRLGGGLALRCIVREENGAPAEAIPVWLLTSGEGRPGLAETYWDPLQSRRTDASGSTTFDPVANGAWIVALAPPQRGAPPGTAYAPVSVRVELNDEEPNPTVELTLTRGRFIRGTIVHPAGGAVRAHVVGQGPNDVFVSEGSDADGAFTLGPLPPGSYTLDARMVSARAGEPSFGPSDPVRAEAGDEDVVLRLTPGASLTVTASHDGRQVAAHFTAVSTGMISSQGRGGSPPLERRFVGLGLGSVVVTATTQDGLVGLVEPYEVSGPGDRSVDVPLVPSGRVRIHNEGPHRYLNCRVSIGDVDVFAGTATAGGDEVFHLPSGPAQVTLTASDPSSTGIPRPLIFEEVHEVEIVAGEEVVLEVGR